MGPTVVTNAYGKKKVQWTFGKMLKPKKILEIFTWTMLMTTIALETSPMWKACTPISVEHGFNLLTTEGRNKAERYLKTEKLDFIVGEWMRGPI